MVNIMNIRKFIQEQFIKVICEKCIENKYKLNFTELLQLGVLEHHAVDICQTCKKRKMVSKLSDEYKKKLYKKLNL